MTKKNLRIPYSCAETPQSHYKISDSKFFRWKRDMVVNMFNITTQTAVLDKFFSKLDKETKTKIFAYATAYREYQVIAKILKDNEHRLW